MDEMLEKVRGSLTHQPAGFVDGYLLAAWYVVARKRVLCAILTNDTLAVYVTSY